jgi:hypothetical protein
MIKIKQQWFLLTFTIPLYSADGPGVERVFCQMFGRMVLGAHGGIHLAGLQERKSKNNVE